VVNKTLLAKELGVSRRSFYYQATKPAKDWALKVRISEYASKSFIDAMALLGIAVSRSKKSSPWENGYQESFYSQFKVDLGDPKRFETLGELVYEIHQAIRQYNRRRIHSVLKMPPAQFVAAHVSATLQAIVH